MERANSLLSDAISLSPGAGCASPMLWQMRAKRRKCMCASIFGRVKNSLCYNTRWRRYVSRSRYAQMAVSDRVMGCPHPWLPRCRQG